MSVIDRLGDDKGYVTKAGVMWTKLQQHSFDTLKIKLRDQRVASLKDNIVVLQNYFGDKFSRLLGATHETRLGYDFQSMIQELASSLIYPFIYVHQFTDPLVLITTP
jgi:hypothetical protein